MAETSNSKVVSILNIDNEDYYIKDEKVRSDLAALIGSADATAAIDSFNEVIDFLAGVTNTDTLIGKLNALDSDKVYSVDWNTSGTNGKITYKKTSSGNSTDVVEVENTATSGSKKPISSGALYTVLNNMTVTAGTGANADKTTIQLKNGTSATVLTTHQDISGKEDKAVDLFAWFQENFTSLPSDESAARALTSSEQAALDDAVSGGYNWIYVGYDGEKVPLAFYSDYDGLAWLGISPYMPDGVVPRGLRIHKTQDDKYWCDIPARIEYELVYSQLKDKPVLKTTNTSALSTNASETITGTINLHKVAKTGTYSDLIGTPTVVSSVSVNGGTAVSPTNGNVDISISATTWNDVKPSGGITTSDLASGVVTSLGKADSAIQGVKVNGSALTPDSNKVVDVTVPVVVNNLTTTTAGSALDATQGKALSDALDDKVDKVSGKGLSTNDYTTTEKNKLAGIAAGAEVNVNADWNATSGDAQILNKPTIPTVPTNVSAFTNDVDYIAFVGYDSTNKKLSFTTSPSVS